MLLIDGPGDFALQYVGGNWGVHKCQVDSSVLILHPNLHIFYDVQVINWAIIECYHSPTEEGVNFFGIFSTLLQLRLPFSFVSL